MPGDPRSVGQAFLGRELHLEVLSAGQGVARGCSFVIFTQDRQHYVAGHVGTGTLRPGEGATIRTTLPLIGSACAGVLICRDIEGNAWAWNLNEDPKRRIYRGGRRGEERMLSQDDILRAFYPDLSTSGMARHYCVAETDTDKLRQRSYASGPRPPDVQAPPAGGELRETLRPADSQVQHSDRPGGGPPSGA